jgi:hypothetical protein
MSAQRAVLTDEPRDEDMLDVDTSAAILRWMETAHVPEGVSAQRWEQWIDDGCRGHVEANGVPVTPAMLGTWARTGSLR